ncbi:MAG: dTDP-4-dehydrorhamnose 3,5-epimerase [Candidatus Kariarchaeaceae archaeon]|jgi:dTDP-4-dehydrorhamnose 3,5-epimerase
MPFEFFPLDIPEVILIQPRKFQDQRGYFMEVFKASDFKANGIDYTFIQDNHSLSSKGVIRGFHFQINPHAQGKLVRVIRGSLFDVAVDIRKGSPTYAKWVGIELSAANQKMLWIPAGFAHGMCSLEDNTELLYKVTAEYSPDHDSGIRYNDPQINVIWPIKNPLVSDKDNNLPLISEAKNNFNFV